MIAVYQIRYDLERGTDDGERALDIRMSMSDDPITPDEFARLYEYAGFDEGATLETVFARWNRGSGAESNAFLDAETRSLSVGDIVVDDDGMHMVARVGFDRLDDLDEALQAAEAEAEAEMARAESAAEAELERRFDRHIDEHGWF